MTINDTFLQDVYKGSVLSSLQKYGFKTFENLCLVFGVELDEDWKLREVVQNALHSYAGKALYKVYFHGNTNKEINYYLCYTEEIYLLCSVFGLTGFRNRDQATELLLNHIEKIRAGESVEIYPLANRNLLKDLDLIYYEKVQA